MKLYVDNGTGKMEEPKKVDFITVVRCKDCKYNPRQTIYADSKVWFETWKWCANFMDDGYCSFGELNDRE